MTNNLLKLEPRQELAIKYYKDPTSETFGNLKRSMMRAGFEENYAHTIAGRGVAWVSEATRRDVNLIEQAEKNLQEYATITIDFDNKNAVDLARLKVDVSKFILKSIGKKKYGDDKEAESPNVQINIVNYNKAPDKATEAPSVIDM